MLNGHLTRISFGSLLSLALFLAGCNMSMRAKYQRTVPLSAPLSPGSTFAAQTHNGSITTNGADVSDCDVIATITARAATEEEAMELADKVEISLEPSGDILAAKIKRPAHLINKSVSVSLDVTVPDETNLQLGTHNGPVRITDVAGTVNATTHNGEVTTERVSGSIVFVTYNGSITCRETSGDAKLKTHNGSAKVFYSKTAPAVSDISIVAHNGSIELASPPDLSARIDASVHNGSIKTDLPITISGTVSKRKLTGIIGSGQGKLRLVTHNGSIRIR
jgi:hypothetical protein